MTVIEGFQDAALSELNDLSKQLKQCLGVGGIVIDDIIELQGDNRIKVSEELQKKGFKIKRKGQL